MENRESRSIGRVKAENVISFSQVFRGHAMEQSTREGVKLFVLHSTDRGMLQRLIEDESNTNSSTLINE